MRFRPRMGILAAAAIAGLVIWPCRGSKPGGATTEEFHGVRLQVAAGTRDRWIEMCNSEHVSEPDMLAKWIKLRRQEIERVQVRTSNMGSKAAADHRRLDDASDPVLHHPPSTDASYASVDLAPLPCPHNFDPMDLNGALQIFGFARAEIDCTEKFMRASTTYGRHLVEMNKLKDYDIVQELIRAETGYNLAQQAGVEVDSAIVDEFFDFQLELSKTLDGWALWDYEFTHWKYHKRPAGVEEYWQLYNTHRLPDYQHLQCPAVPLVYRLWGNFPTCAPSRLRDIPRFTDAYVSAMTVDNWRASYRDFLSESYNYNVSFFSGGDPTQRLSKGAHSIFAGVFIQKLPTDLWCYQQVIHDLRPKYIIDLGGSQGGSAVWFASMMKLFEIEGGKVISVDLPVEQAYWLSRSRAEDAARRLKVERYIDWNYVVGGSTNADLRAKVESLCSSAPCMVISDSDHDFAHTYHEMEWYAGHVGVGQYLVVEDTNIYGWSGWMNLNDPNQDGLKKGPMESANDFEFNHRADYVRTDWCAKHYGGVSQTQNGWFFRKALRARGSSPKHPWDE